MILAMAAAPDRHRLTITISRELLEILRVEAGSRRISHWLEEAAWRRLRAERDRDLIGIGTLVETQEDLADLGFSPKWSNLGE